MPALAQDFTVIAVDQRGMGLTDKPEDGYDAGTLGQRPGRPDGRELGHERFAVVGHDTGIVIAYALAADHPDRVDRLVRRRDPRCPRQPRRPRRCSCPRRSTTSSGTSRSTGPAPSPSSSITGREDIFFGYEFAIQGGPALDPDVIDYYVANFTTPESLRGGLGFYRAWDAHLAQNASA